MKRWFFNTVVPITIGVGVVLGSYYIIDLIFPTVPKIIAATSEVTVTTAETNVTLESLNDKLNKLLQQSHNHEKEKE